MPELLLARHAKSDWPAGIVDHERPLAARGRRDAIALGNWLHDVGAIDRVVVSSALRTRQTWEIASAQCSAEFAVEFSDEIYEAEWSRLLDVARGSQGADRVLLVGHNPGMEELAGVLAQESVPRTMMEEKFPTSAVARLAFTGEWSRLDAGDAQLVEFVIARG